MTMFFLPCLGGGRCLAQDKHAMDLSPVTAADFTSNASSVIDSSGAVILADIGDIHFVGNERSWFSYVFQRHTRIKILNKKAFDLATVRISLYRPLEDPEKLDKVVASTYNLENGQVTEVRLDKKDIFEDIKHKEHTETKFTLPALREGSIIDYTYTIISPYDAFLPTWQFQSERCPCLWSELMVEIPQALFYTLVKQGIHPYAVDKGSEGGNTYRLGDKNGGWMTVSATVTKHHWLMKDIPAMRVEGYLYCPESYVDKIDFQLSKTYDGEDYHDFYNSWAKATEQLMSKDVFGATLDENNPLITDCIKKAISAGGDFAARAREIYYYLSDNFTCDDHESIYIGNTLSDVVRKRSGTVGDINLLLVAMLRKIGLKADPVVLTTRDIGFNLATYPILERLNYVIVRAVIGEKVVYLDAAHPKLGFGQLDEECYNGHARIISKTDSGSVYFEADSLREGKVTVVFISTTDNGEEGTWTSTLGPQESYKLREHVNDQGEKAYFKNIQTSYGEDVTVSDGGIDSLDQPEEPVKVHYSFKFHSGEDNSKIYVNPFIGAGLRSNPFKAAERKYPIEMPYVSDDVYVFTMEVPDGYTVEELPKSARATLNEHDGMFEYLIGAQEGMIQLRCRLKLNKANYAPEDYGSLRDLYALVVKKEAELIVLKKK
jgi:Domain of Unknown Function with PDB structure (DUF3857)/Domain of Unknown Function with PDB structure (DUF3858)/Transglutaminase-like superfamily